jgi:hypothetical protein
MSNELAETFKDGSQYQAPATEGDGNPDLHGYPNQDHEEWAKSMDEKDMAYRVKNEEPF